MSPKVGGEILLQEQTGIASLPEKIGASCRTLKFRLSPAKYKEIPRAFDSTSTN